MSLSIRISGASDSEFGQHVTNPRAAACASRVNSRMTSASTYFGGFTGGYTIMKDYVRARRQSTREAFVPLHHPAGHAQVDFGEAAVELQGQREKIASA